MKQLLYSLICLCCACQPSGTTQTTTAQQDDAAPAIEFSADSAYRFVEEQVAFGYRIPNTPAHKACAAYLAAKLEQFGATVTLQEADVTAYDGTVLHATNIIGSYRPELPDRILLCAHWDTRPWADHDPDEANHRKPIDGANDGASGVGVLLEVARQLSGRLPACGVDIVLFDAEDYGTPEFHTGTYKPDTWCLGSQHWAKEAKKNGYKARYGILLDMVGAPDAIFPREYYSTYYAAGVLDKVWQTARSLGFGQLFVQTSTYPVTDDHYYVNTLAGIPCIDIVHYNPHGETGFGDYWHTLDDNMDNISRQTLYAVGKTVLTVIYDEQ